MHEISIIIPVYNKEKYLTGILEDIYRQSFCDFECILIDDGSYDTSGKICDLYAEKDNRFQVRHIPNSGVSHARNVGLSVATGRYITFIDADDHIEVNFLGQLYTDITSSGADLVIVGPAKFWENDRPNEVPELPYTGLTDIRKIMPNFAQVQKKTGIYGFCCGKMFPRELAQGVQFSEQLRLAEDFEFYLHIYPKIKTIYFNNSCKYHYLQEAENSSAIFQDNKIDYLSQLKVNLLYRKFLVQENYYDGQNREIVEKLLTNYAYFTVLHAKRTAVCKTVQTVHDVVSQEKISTTGKGILKHGILYCIKKNRGNAVNHLLAFYDFLRTVKRICINIIFR